MNGSPNQVVAARGPLDRETLLAGAPPPRLPPQMAGTTSDGRPIDHLFSWLRSRAETGFVVVALFLFSDAVFPLLLAETADEVRVDDGTPLLRYMFLALQAITLLLVLLRWRSVGRTALRHKLTLLIVVLVPASVLWSIEAGVTLRRGIAFLGTTLFGFYLSTRYSTETVLRLLAAAFGLLLVLSVLFAVALPGVGIHPEVHAGAWRGVMPHKNSFGQITALAALVFFLIWRASDRYSRAALAGMLLAISLLLLSRSATALVMVCLLAALWPLYSLLQWRVRLMVPALISVLLIGGGAASVLLANRETAFRALGRDPTLTGRTDMWAVIWQAVERSPWLGYGYRAFWRDSDSGRQVVWRTLEWTPTSAHNGLVELALDVGMLGTAVFLAGFITAVGLAIRAIRVYHHPISFWPLMFLTFLLLCNITESLLLQQNNILWILYVAVVSSRLLHMTHGGAPTGRWWRPGGATPITPEPACAEPQWMPPAGSALLSPAVRRRVASGAPAARPTVPP